MALNVLIREGTSEDQDGILDLYPGAFPDEDLTPLVTGLLADTASTLSLVAELDSEIVAHVVFTDAEVEGSNEKLSLLGPLCVSSKYHRMGVGTAIVKSGLARLDARQVSSILVLGAPSYYGRFGFRKSNDITAPYVLPDVWRDAWQMLPLRSSELPIKGRLLATPPWQHEHLWMP